MTFENVNVNKGGDYNATTGAFTCRVSGFYFFSITLMKDKSKIVVDYASCGLFVNTDYKIFIGVNPTDDNTDNGLYSASTSVAFRLDVGDTVSLSNCTTSDSFDSWMSSFSGFLLYVS